MELEYGATVIDSNSQVLGTVNRLVRNLSTGEIRKFIVYRKTPEKDLFLSPEDVLETTPGMVKLNVALEELGEDRAYKIGRKSKEVRDGNCD